MIDFQDPQIWWFLARASGILAWVLMTLTVVWGILLKTRILRGADNPEWLKATHRYISGLSLSMIVVHLFALWRDEFVQFGVRELFVPFASEWNPVGVALGIFAVYLVLAIQITALSSKWLPEKVWKGIHLSSYVVIVLVALHSGLSGSDVGTPWYTVISLILITTTTLAGIIRIVIAGRATPKRPDISPLGAPGTPALGALAIPSRSPQPDPRFDAKVVDKHVVGDRIAVVTLQPLEPSALEPWEAGAHITLHLPIGLERQYSLASDPADHDRFTIAVADSGTWGGASGWIRHQLQVGDVVSCSGPRNNFPLRAAHRYQFIAAGIGVTPILSMVRSVPRGRNWSVLYIGSRRDDMVFVKELEDLCGDRLTVWETADKGHRPDLRQLLDQSADVYACGPTGFLDELETLVDPSRLHLERFTPKVRESTSSLGSFTVVAALSGVRADVSEDETIVDALSRVGVTLPTSCNRGVCGSCEVAVLAGTPEHLDSVMSDADKDEVGVMYPCVSRSKTATLTVNA